MDAHGRFSELAAVITARRTCKVYSGAAIAREQLQALLELTRWAPTHRLTEPWRFAVLEQPAIARLIAFLRVDPAFAQLRSDARSVGKLEKLLERLPSAGALVLATWVRAEDPRIDHEEHAAASAAVQNLLLGVEAAGLAGYWSTTEVLVAPATLHWCGADPEREGALGCIWIGHPAGAPPPPPPRSPLEERVRWLHHP